MYSFLVSFTHVALLSFCYGTSITGKEETKVKHKNRGNMKDMKFYERSSGITTDVVGSNLDQGEVYNIM
jgi:hypothetical protein